ncbi:flagellar biosynthetic protein FliO [Xanthobacter autotrophicus DSM 431]|uniref:flagellar biosynthetic protein FliO n=1 Tax=Xanthobacter nonsaccharivorans TaxID=3119912 RepID=UPI00372BE1FA
MLQQLFGTELAFPIRVAVALAVIAALLGVTVVVMRRLAARGRANAGRGRSGPRLAVLDTVAVDQRRKLVLVRRDEVEHLLLIGGNSDLVVEPQITARDEAPPAAVSPPVNFGAVAQSSGREAPALQRPSSRQRLSAATPTALAALPEAPSEPAALPSIPEESAKAEPAPVSPAAPAPTIAAPSPEPAPHEERRPFLGRKPLLRGDGTMSTPRQPTRPVVGATEAPVREAPVREAPAPQPREAEPARRLFSTEPRGEQKVEPKVEPAAESAARAETAPEPVAATPSSRLDAMAQRLDAALKDSPGTPPQLSLSDLLGDSPEAEAAAKEEPVPAPAPSLKLEPEAAAEPPAERAPARFVFQSRPRSESPRIGGEPRVRPDPLPRSERQAAEPAERPARPEPALRPREFTFRQGTEPATREEAPRREFSFLREGAAREGIVREPAIRALEVKAPEVETESRKAPEPAADVRPSLEAPAIEPRLAAPRAGEAPASPPAAPAVTATPEPAVDPLDDFDAEMANLLGRNTARSR